MQRNLGSIREGHYGFLHIGKTAGSSITDVIEACNNELDTGIVKFPHRYTLPEIFRVNPLIKISFVLRDPIERFVSGFYSRLRSGRPTYNYLWDEREAISFLYFEDANTLAESLSSRDERMQSAAYFAMNSISHVRRNYVYHLYDVEFIKRNADRIYFVGNLDNIDNQVYRIFEPCGVPREFVERHFKHSHKSPTCTKELLSSLSDLAVSNLKSFLKNDYKIYDYCLNSWT